MGGIVCKGTAYSPDDFDSQVEYLRSRYRLNDDQIIEYKAFFNEYSDNGKLIQRQNFRKVYQILYKNDDASSFADRVFDAFDKNNSGTVDFVEFVAGMITMDSKKIEQKISMAFTMFDKDGSNTVTKQELIDMFQAYYTLLGPHITTSPVDTAYEIYDKMGLNSNQTISYDGFTELAKSDPKILAILDPQIQA